MEHAGSRRNCSEQEIFALSYVGNARRSARQGSRQDRISGGNHRLGAVLEADSIRDLSRLMLRRATAGSGAILLVGTIFSTTYPRVIRFNLREWHNLAVGSEHSIQNFLRWLGCHAFVCCIRISIITLGGPTAICLCATTCLRGMPPFSTKPVHFSARDTSFFCAPEPVFLRCMLTYLREQGRPHSRDLRAKKSKI